MELVPHFNKKVHNQLSQFLRRMGEQMTKIETNPQFKSKEIIGLASHLGFQEPTQTLYHMFIYQFIKTIIIISRNNNSFPLLSLFFFFLLDSSLYFLFLMTKDIEALSPQTFLYEAQLQGIRCTGCTKKITDTLMTMPSVKQVSINVIGEKGLFFLDSQEILTSIEEKIKGLGFKVLNGFEEIKTKTDSQDTSRSIHFKFQTLPEIKEFQKDLELKFPGILSVTSLSPNIMAIKYNSKAVQGRQIRDHILQQPGNSASEYNHYAEGFKRQKQRAEVVKLRDVLLALLVCAAFIITVLILPQFSFFDSVQIYPEEIGVFSIYVILLFILMLFSLVYFGKSPIIRACVNFWKHRLLNMETLVALGSLSALILSIFLIGIYYYEIYHNDKSTSESSMRHLMGSSNSSDPREERLMMIQEIVHMLETASLILAIITVGKYLESKSKQSIMQMSEQMFPENELLSNLTVKSVEIKNKKFEIASSQEYDISYLDKDAFIQINAPFRLLTDATVVHITSTDLKAVDQVCFGWDDAFKVSVGTTLKSGSDITEGSAILQVNNPIEESMLFQISKQLDIATTNSESTQSGIAALFKVFSEHFVKFIILSAFISFIVWIIIIAKDAFYIKDYCKWCFPIERFISVLVASCPCALGLAIPSVIVVTLNIAMKNSILIKKNTVFEKIKRVSVIIFDKTGTLFTKADKISEFTRYESLTKYSESQIWQIIQLMEKDNKHPLAELLYKESVSRGCSTFTSDFKITQAPSFDGNGLEAFIFDSKKNGQKLSVLLGNMKLLASKNITIPNEIFEEVSLQLKSGFTVLFLSINDTLVASIKLDNSNNLRPEAKDVVQYLTKQLKKEVYILSGDHKDTVLEVGRYLGIPETNLIGECEAFKKKELIKRLKSEQKKEVMMIGDGLNDILSLEEATLGVSINAKSELNLLASDIVVLKEDLWSIVLIFELLEKSRQFIYINLIWAFAYNVFMIPMAAGVFEKVGLNLSPVVSSASMSGSSIIVVLFSSLLRLFSFKRQGINEKNPTKQFNMNTRHNNKILPAQGTLEILTQDTIAIPTSDTQILPTQSAYVGEDEKMINKKNSNEKIEEA